MLKSVCVPGLNCYSCPIGSLQAVIGSSKFSASYYIVGILVFLGALLGRVVCGFLCPFGWFQELLHKIPSRKFSTRPLHILTYLKYVVVSSIMRKIVLALAEIHYRGRFAAPWFSSSGRGAKGQGRRYAACLALDPL